MNSNDFAFNEKNEQQRNLHIIVSVNNREKNRIFIFNLEWIIALMMMLKIRFVLFSMQN